MNWLEIFLMGLVLGLSEFVPISSGGHQRLVLHLFGMTQMDPLCHLVLTAGVLLAVLTSCNGLFRRYLAERAIAQMKRRHRTYGQRYYDYRIVKGAILPLVIVYAICFLFQSSISLPGLALAFLINGIVLFVIGNMRQGNKDSHRMTVLDSTLMGAFGGISAIAGISLIGTVSSTAVARGANRQSALNWALVISAPALLIRMAIDLLLMIIGGTALSITGFLCCLGGAVFAFIGGRISIRFVRFIINRSGLSGFSYYVWGAAILTFILYLIT
ncbi:MAG: undecaprenyl-diphosphate phosphatase [Ruminococcaceae bacterium]|nr:undecaprenyl-diphosphate phosphatase [Oscillospiraceae bacterium]